MNNGNPRTRGRRSNNVAQAGNIVDYMLRTGEKTDICSLEHAISAWRGWFRMHWRAARRLWKTILGGGRNDG